MRAAHTQARVDDEIAAHGISIDDKRVRVATSGENTITNAQCVRRVIRRGVRDSDTMRAHVGKVCVAVGIYENISDAHVRPHRENFTHRYVP